MQAHSAFGMRGVSLVGGLFLAFAVGAGGAFVHLQAHAALPVAGHAGQLRSAPPIATPSPYSTPAVSRSATKSGAPASQHPISTSAAPGSTNPVAPTVRIVIGSEQQVLINQDRAGYGLPALTWNSCLYNVAVANAQRMAAQGYISHANGVYQDLACAIGQQSGENVGYYSGGFSDPVINTAFMNSAEHKANIMGPYRYVATAWALGANGAGYIAVEFD